MERQEAGGADARSARLPTSLLVQVHPKNPPCTRPSPAAPPAAPGWPPPRVGRGSNHGAGAAGLRRATAASSQGSLGRNGAGSRAAAAAGRGQELPASPPLASWLWEHPSRAGLGLPEPPTSPAKGVPRAPGSDPACLLEVRGPPPPLPAVPRLPQARKLLLLDGPNRMVPVTGFCIRILGRTQAGRDGNCVTSSDLGPFLLHRCRELGRVTPNHLAGAVLIYTSPGCNADCHGGSSHMGLGRSQWAACVEPRGVARRCPPGWDITQEAACSLAAPWELAGPAPRPSLGSSPLSLCTDPP